MSFTAWSKQIPPQNISISIRSCFYTSNTICHTVHFQPSFQLHNVTVSLPLGAGPLVIYFPAQYQVLQLTLPHYMI